MHIYTVTIIVVVIVINIVVDIIIIVVVIIATGRQKHLAGSYQTLIWLTLMMLKCYSFWKMQDLNL